MSRRWWFLAVTVLVGAGVLASCAGDKALIVYSGRTKDLIGPLVQRFEDETGIDVKVRYGGSPELASALLEEGDRARADVFIAQDAGSLGEVAGSGLLSPLDASLTGKVAPTYRDPGGRWVGLSARARVVAYNSDRLKPEQLPSSIRGFVDPSWKNRLGWAPVNGSFQSFITAFRVLEGDAAAEQWLTGIKANSPRVFPDNVSIVQAVSAGDIDAGFVNHYYVERLHAQGQALKAQNRYYEAPDPGALVNVAGVAVMKSSGKVSEANRFVEFLLSPASQQYFAEQTYEVPTVEGVDAKVKVPDISEFKTPEVELGSLGDVKGTTEMLTRLGIL